MAIKSIDARQFPEFDGHKAVYRFEEPSVRLRGFIAIHNDNLGPATGGTRMFPYASEKDAIADVLRLSRTMTYKCALAGVRHGGGKVVIIGDPEKDKTEELLRSYARVVNELNGEFSTGEDVGITEDDVQIMLQESPHFNGRRGVAGDPSPYAALSTFLAMQAAAGEMFGEEDLFGKAVAVKGVGKVGSELIHLLSGAGASVIAADIRDTAAIGIRARFPAVKFVKSEEVHKQQAEIFSPCAMGDDVTEENVAEVKARIICGAANNQLATARVGELLFKRGILFVSDYVANAGGLINVVDELEAGGYNRNRVIQRIQEVKPRVRKIIQRSQKEKQSPSFVADQMAEEIFLNGKRRGKRVTPHVSTSSKH